MSVFRVRGEASALAVALDVVLFRCTVLGVVEGDGEFTVSIAEAALPELSSVLATAIPDEPRAAHLTGLEGDRTIVLAQDLVVRPPWVAAQSGFRGIELVVPRAMAFGSGEHASTQCALLVMHATWMSTCRSTCDVGTGSGILLAYAQARGCSTLAGCDVEAESVAAASELMQGAKIVLGGPDRLLAHAQAEAGFDCVVANMAIFELVPVLHDILALWNRRGVLVIAGTRGNDEAAVIAGRVRSRILARAERQGFVAQAFVS